VPDAEGRRGGEVDDGEFAQKHRGLPLGNGHASFERARRRAESRRGRLRASPAFSRVLVAWVVVGASRMRRREVWQRERARVRGWHSANVRAGSAALFARRRRCRRSGAAVRKEGTRAPVCPGLLRGVDEKGRRVSESVQATRQRVRASVCRLSEEPFCKSSPKTQAGRLRCQTFLATVSRRPGRRRVRRRAERLWPPVCFSSVACRRGRR